MESELAREWDTLRGQVCSAIESWGLEGTQEDGAKATFKALTYAAQARVLEAASQDKLLTAVATQRRVVGALETFLSDLERDQQVSEEPDRVEFARGLVAERVREEQIKLKGLRHLARLQAGVR